MKKYKVQICHISYLDIEADSEKEAINSAKEEFQFHLDDFMEIKEFDFNITDIEE